MTEKRTEKDLPTDATPPGPETQKQRWVKYGSNVVLASVVVIVLAVLLTYIAQRTHRRLDTTAGGAYSLTPQTKNILHDLSSPVKIISLYSDKKPTDEGDDAESAPRINYRQRVADLLEEYKRNSSKVDVEAIDPISSPTKVDDLIAEVTDKYGGEVRKYRQFLDEYPKQFTELKALSLAEAGKAETLPFGEIANSQELQNTVGLAIITVRGVPQQLEKWNQNIERFLRQKPPDYKGAVDGVRDAMGQFSDLLDRNIAEFTHYKDDPKVPQAIRTYMGESIPRYQEIKKRADALVEKIKGLGQLKLDELRQSLRQRNSVLVLGEKDMRVLPFEQVWQADPAARRQLGSSREIAPSFAGEQQITAAILGLTSARKPKVAFVRPGGAPLVGSPFQPGPLSVIAGRLRDYNFDVVEKDLSGMWAMQSQMQGMPSAPEPSDEELKDAIWVVFSYPINPNPMNGAPPPAPIAPKVAEHLKGGGGAMVLLYPKGEDLKAALDEWGVKARTDLLAVHDRIESSGTSRDFIDEARRVPVVFIVNEYGEHLLARPINSLDSVLIAVCPVQADSVAGHTSWNLLPLPTEPKSWGETDAQAALEGAKVTFDPDRGDLPAPVYGGAAVENQGGNRIVVLGAGQLPFNQFLQVADPELHARGVDVARFPGNGELFVNSVLWLAKMEHLIAISPASMQVSRLAPMSPAAQRFWRVGVLLVGMPMLVLIAGALMYYKRRD